MELTRRSFLHAAAAGAAGVALRANSAAAQAKQGKGKRIKQSLVWWCFGRRGVKPEQLVREAASIGYASIEMAPREQWDRIRDAGLAIAIIVGHRSLTDGLNRRENHDRIEDELSKNIEAAAEYGIPGLICLALVKSGTIDALPTLADGSPDTEKTYSHLIANVLPVGVRGVVVAALLAALMSTVSGALNSIATLCSYDIYRRFKPEADDRHLIRVGRIATFVAMCVAVVWTLGIGGQKSIFQMMIDVFPVVAPPTAVVFFWGVFWRRASAKASLITLVGGSILGLGLFVVNVKGLNVIGDFEIGSLLQAAILFVFESLCLIVLSYIFPHKHTTESEALVWKSPLDALRSENAWRGVGDYRLLAALLVAVMIGLYVWFAGEDYYYPLDGQITLADGTPVVGAKVFLETDDPRLNVELVTDADGRYAYGTAAALGGAPADTKYRVRIVPAACDYLVEIKEDPQGEPTVDRVLAVMPSGTAVERRVVDGKVELVVKTDEEQTVGIDESQLVLTIRATDVPQRFQSFDSSGLQITIEADKNHVDLKLPGT